MRVAVVGLGAVGGLLAARLARAGHEVCAVARGATLERIRSAGLTVESAAGSDTVQLVVSDDARSLGPQELVVIALKAPSLAGAVASIEPLLDASTVLLPAMNGVPWWFLPAALPDQAPLESVDPGGHCCSDCRSHTCSAASST
jgi:2-dehydropantoate 2-reductase